MRGKTRRTQGSSKTSSNELKKSIQLTANQRKFAETIEDNQIIVCTGPAGTAKTFVTMHTSLKLIGMREYDKVIITKPAQESGEKLGFLPGDINEKIAPYMESFVNTLEKMIGKLETKQFVERGFIEPRPLA